MAPKNWNKKMIGITKNFEPQKQFKNNGKSPLQKMITNIV